MITATVLFRRPGEEQVFLLTQNTGWPERLPSCDELNGKEGFVFAPFSPSADEPIYLIKPDHQEMVCLDTTEEELTLQPESGQEREDYAIDFANFHAHLLSGEFDKLVLARRSRMHSNQPIDARQLFARACKRHPRQFIAMVSIKDFGSWLMATPETLLRGHNTDGGSQVLSTMALAGTMVYDERRSSLPIEEVWSTKNLMEQHCVSSYITERIEQFTSDFGATSPHTIRAAGLMHLCTDFNFTLPDTSKTGDVIAALHPTPAVCGMPKEEAQTFIRENESFDRHYYSGFIGTLSGNDIDLYVSLRCMHIHANPTTVDFYAGGGLLPDSVEEEEWRETEAKKRTMKALF